MTKTIYTAYEIRRLALDGSTELVLSPGDIVTPLARDDARARGLTIVDGAPVASALDTPADGRTVRSARLITTRGMEMHPFPFERDRPTLDVRVGEAITPGDDGPMGAGVLSMRAGTFARHINHDHIEMVLEGELHIGTPGGTIIALPGDVVELPRGIDITFGTPSWVKLFYVTYHPDQAASGHVA